MSKPKSVPFAKYTELAVKNAKLEDDNAQLNVIRQNLETNLLKECESCRILEEDCDTALSNFDALVKEYDMLVKEYIDLKNNVDTEIYRMERKTEHLTKNVKAFAARIKYLELPWYSKLALWFKNK